MPINQDLLDRVEATADDWGPTGHLGNDPTHAKKADESKNVDEALGLHPISIRFTKEMVRDLKAIAQLNGMGYQPLIREICKRFVDAEKRAIVRDQALRRQQELERDRALEREAEEAAAAVEQAEAAALQHEESTARLAA